MVYLLSAASQNQVASLGLQVFAIGGIAGGECLLPLALGIKQLCHILHAVDIVFAVDAQILHGTFHAFLRDLRLTVSTF